MAMEPVLRYESACDDLTLNQGTASLFQEFGRINYGDYGDSDRQSMRSHRDY